MPRFDKRNIIELKAFLYDSCDHDAKIESFNCDYVNDSIEIVLFNPYFDVRINLTFNNIMLVLSMKGDWIGKRWEIIGIAAEDDFSHLEKYLPNHSEYNEDSLYLLFEMFSGDELHIVAKEVIIEKRKTGDGSAS